MIALAPRPDPRTFGLYETVWDQHLKADKAPVQVLRASAAWISAPHPVQAIGGSS